MSSDKIYPKTFRDMNPENAQRSGHAEPLEDGQVQGVHFTIEREVHELTLKKIEQWFEHRNDVILVAKGVTEKEEAGFVLMEWDQYEIDPLFLEILEHDEDVLDFSVYTCDGREE